MGFNFSLQAVLDHRHTQEEQRQREFSEAQAKVQTVMRQQVEIRQDIARRNEQIRSRQQTGLSFAHRELYENWIGAQEAQWHRLEQEREELEKVAETKRQALVKAVQARTVMENLRDQEQAQWLQEEKRAEMRLFNEIAVREFNEQRRREKDSQQEERIAR